MHTDPTNNQTATESTSGSKILATAILASLAAAIGLLAWYNKDEISDEVKSRAEDLAKKYKKTRNQIQKNIMEFFGEISDELEGRYLEVESDIMAAVEDVKDKSKLTKKAYDQIVDDVVNVRGKKNKWSTEAMAKLVVNLQEDYEQWREEMGRN